MAKKKTKKKKTKKKVKKPTWKSNPAEALDAVVLSMRDEANMQLNRSIEIGTEAETTVVGLPFPSLSMRYLFGSTVFPLGRVLQIVGQEESNKSALLYELYRWHCAYGGGGVHVEVENKDSPEMRNALLGRNPRYLNRLQIVPGHSAEQWQNAIRYYQDKFMELMDQRGGPGRTIPVCLGVDSLTAVLTERMGTKLYEDNFIPREAGRELAKSIADFMRLRSTTHRGYPITIAATNHLKPATDQRGRPIKNVPGGKAMPFMATHILELKKYPTKSDINYADLLGKRLIITANKNSLGPSRRNMPIEFIWWWAPDADGVTRQWFLWDWDTASIECLLQIENIRKGDFKKLMDVCDLHPKKSHPRTVWSRTLGIPEGDPVSWREAGQILEQRPDVLEALYPLLGINPGYEFQPGLDYRQMEEEAAREGAKRAEKLYAKASLEAPELSPEVYDPNAELEDTVIEFEDYDGAVGD